MADLDPVTAAPGWVTGPGHGEIVGVQPSGDGGALTFSPYSVGSIALSTGVQLTSGGMSLAPDVQRLEVVISDKVAAPNGFVALSDPAVQRAATEEVTALQNTPSGLVVAGAFALDGGPAKLIQRANTLYQIAAVADSDYRVRVFDLGAAALGPSPIVPRKDVVVSVPATPLGGRRADFVPDVDPDLGQIAVTEVWTGEGSTSYSVVWASFGDPPGVLARGPLDREAKPALHGGRLMLVDSLRVRLSVPDGGSLGSLWTREASTGSYFENPVGWDGDRRGYVFYVDENNAPAIVALDGASGAVVASAPVPEEIHAATASGGRLVLAGIRSVSVLDPACDGDGLDAAIPDADVPDAISDGGEESDSGSVADADSGTGDPCGIVAACPEGGLARSSVAGDANGDGCVDSADTQLVMSCLGRSAGDACKISYLADLDRSGTVDTRDYLLTLQNAGHGCDGG